MRSIAKRFFQDLADFKPGDFTLNNYSKINDAEKLYSMFGDTLYDYMPVSSEQGIKALYPKNKIREYVPHRYTIEEINAIHSLSTMWFAFFDGDFSRGIGFNGSVNEMRQALAEIPGIVFLSTNGLNLMQHLKNRRCIEITYCKTVKDIPYKLQIAPV